MEEKPVEENPAEGDSSTLDKQKLLEKVKELETKNKKMSDEFNIQRAKLKDLYVQKEIDYNKLVEEVVVIKRELDDLRSQVVINECKNENKMQLLDRKAQEEIASLQQLVQETIEESSNCKLELERLHDENMRLKQENREMREEILSHQDTPTLAPVISHVRKTLARKLGADSGGSHDSLDESMRKAQEDAEVLRSLVVPLEEEIKALKEKLRSTDEDLQSYRSLAVQNPNISSVDGAVSSIQGATTSSDIKRTPSPQSQVGTITTSSSIIAPTTTVTAIEQKTIEPLDPTAVNKSTSMEKFQCDMCQNYELKLVQSKKILENEKKNISKLEKSLEDAKEELKKEAALRHDLEGQWQEKREAHKEEVQFLNEQVKKNEKELINIQKQFLDTKEEINKQLLCLTDDRERINKHLETLQSDNDFLSGKYLATSEEIENQNINLPNNVEELQELLLKQQNDLIQARVGCEFEKRKCVSYVDETQILRDQLEAVNLEKREFEKKVQSRTRSLEERLKEVLIKEQNYESIKEKYVRNESEMNKQIAELRLQIVELQEANKKLDKANVDLKNKMKILQDDLATSEHVQKDFVKLSQSLQIELEKFRRAETQVRWQDDEDVEKCQNCSVPFTVTCRKHHCRHCGTIYCEKCLTKTVLSGPRQKPARVCDMCHTLLTPHEAPYFSQDPPQSPT